MIVRCVNAEASTDATSGETDAGIDATTTKSIDLALLTYASCKEAGIVSNGLERDMRRGSDTTPLNRPEAVEAEARIELSP